MICCCHTYNLSEFRESEFRESVCLANSTKYSAPCSLRSACFDRISWSTNAVIRRIEATLGNHLVCTLLENTFLTVYRRHAAALYTVETSQFELVPLIFRLDRNVFDQASLRIGIGKSFSNYTSGALRCSRYARAQGEAPGSRKPPV